MNVKQLIEELSKLPDDVNASQDTLIAAEIARLDAAIYNRGAE